MTSKVLTFAANKKVYTMLNLLRIGKKNYLLFFEQIKIAHACMCIVALLMLLASSSFAQSNQTEVKIFQEAFGLEKKAAIANFMKLDESAAAFWKIYDEYEFERKKIGSERIEIISDYAKNYTNLSEEKILELYKRTQAVKKSFDKLQTTYFKKMKREIGTSKAAQFWQLEGYFNSLIQANIYTQIPFIGENKK